MSIIKTKRLIFIPVLITALFIVSGCTPINPSVSPEIENEQSRTNVQEAGDKNEKITQEKNDGYVIESGNNGWINFISNECGFEISYPGEFKLLKHCEKTNDEVGALLSINNYEDDDYDEYPYGRDGNMYFAIVKESENIENLGDWVRSKFKEGVDYSGKLGNTKVSVYQKSFINSEAYVINLEYDSAIEGPPGLFKYMFFQKNGITYRIVSQILYNNKKNEELFYEITNTFKFTE